MFGLTKTMKFRRSVCTNYSPLLLSHLTPTMLSNNNSAIVSFRPSRRNHNLGFSKRQKIFGVFSRLPQKLRQREFSHADFTTLQMCHSLFVRLRRKGSSFAISPMWASSIGGCFGFPSNGMSALSQSNFCKINLMPHGRRLTIGKKGETQYLMNCWKYIARFVHWT